MSILRRPRAGVTLIELMVVVAILGVLIAVVAPSVRKLLDTQRLRGVSGQLTTDIQFTRTEAASRQERTGMSFKYVNGSQSCYTIHTCGSGPIGNCACDCTAAEGSRCPAASGGNTDPPREIRTVTVLSDRGVEVGPTTVAGGALSDARVLFDPATGAMVSYFPTVIVGPPAPPPGQFIGTTRLVAPATATGVIRTEISSLGRPRTCAGTAAC